VLRKAASDLADSAHAHRTFAVALAENNQLLKAEKSFLRAHELEPTDWESPSGLGNVYQAMNRYEQAESWYRKSLQLNPDFAPAWLNLGILLESARPKDAVEAFGNALRLQPQLMPARLSLASLLATCRDQTVRNGEAALHLLAPLGAALEQDPGLLELRAAAHAANGDWEAAKKWQQLAIDKFAAKSQDRAGTETEDTLLKARAALAAYVEQRARLK
jgi:Flp pilus assembly protein TadD